MDTKEYWEHKKKVKISKWVECPLCCYKQFNTETQTCLECDYTKGN